MRAFTLIELLVVMCILGVLAALLLPAASLVMDEARSTRCRSALRQIGLASQGYALDNNQLLPATTLALATAYSGGTIWTDLIGPYAEQDGQTSKSTAARILWQCPKWQGRTDLEATRSNTFSGSWWSKPGYGMNPRLGLQASGGTTADSDYYGYYYPSGNTKRSWVTGQVSKAALRIFVGDSQDWHLATSATQFNGWDATYTTPSGNQSGDPLRHRKMANYLFTDCRVDGLTPSDAVQAINDPH